MERSVEAVSPFVALSDAMANAVEVAGRALVAIHARRRIPSSGVHWAKGVVVTAAHTLERTEGIQVTLPSGEDVEAVVAGRDAGTDVAVLRLEGAPEFAVVQPAEDGALRTGALVLALGRPWRGPPTASLGLISAVGEEWRTWQGGRVDRMVRLDIAVHDGFSGGPLVDASGRVLGINTSTLARGAPVTIPAATVRRVSDELLARGRVRRGFLGLAMHPVRLPRAVSESVAAGATTALMIVAVESDGPGDRAGVLLGDILLAIDDAPMRDLRAVAASLGPDSVGATRTVTLLRAGRVEKTSITIGERMEEQ